LCTASLLALPANASHGQGNSDGQSRGKADHPHGQAKQKDKDKDKDKANKGATPKAAERTDERTRFRGLDRNGDGRVSRAEWDGDNSSFANHDWNRDGVLSGTELDPGAARPGSRASMAEAPRTTSRAKPAEATPRGGESDEVLFARRDANNDRRLSRAEWTLDSRTFERLDTNKDGWLSPYEFGVGR
jgi:hypothetical protein